MKKIFLFFVLLMLCPATLFAQASTSEHSSKEANFRVQTLAPWSQMTIEKKNLEKSPGWLVKFHKEGELSASAPFALYIVDGRKNEDIKQTSADFERGHANFILFQIVEAEKMKGPSEELTLKDSEIKKYGEKSFIYLEYERLGLKVYRVMTALNNYTYAFNCQITSLDDGEAIKANLELMMKSLSKY